MPNYKYECSHCECYSLRVRKIRDRDDPLPCFNCGELMYRHMGEPQLRSDTNFQMEAITSTGEKVPGSFTGSKRRGWLSANRKKR